MYLAKLISKIEKCDFVRTKSKPGSPEHRFSAAVRAAFTECARLNSYLFTHTEQRTREQIKASWPDILAALKNKNESDFLSLAGTAEFEPQKRVQYLNEKYRMITQSFDAIVAIPPTELSNAVFINHEMALEIICLLFGKERIQVQHVVIEKGSTHSTQMGTGSSDLLPREFGVEFLEGETVVGVALSMHVFPQMGR